MNMSPIESSETLCVGTVEAISPDKIEVLLNIDAPESVSLNTGTPRPFPRVNSYVLIPNDERYLVGQIEWIAIERSTFPKRKGIRDFGLVDLPYPLRKMTLNPLGTLHRRTAQEGQANFCFKRGADSFPSVGVNVLLPTQNQLRSIVESGENRRVKIGTSPLAGNAEVKVDPDRLFGRHLAVLGNTGSGKSCSVAGLIRWSLEAAQRDGKRPNARFIVLDPNGEYGRAFAKDKGILEPRIFRVDASDADSKKLCVPLWFWNSSEWSSFTQASGKTQRPLLKRALREIKVGGGNIFEDNEEKKKIRFRRYLSSNMISIQRDLKGGGIKTEESKFGFKLKAIGEDLKSKLSEFSDYKEDIACILNNIDIALNSTFNIYEKNGKSIEYYRAFTESQAENILKSISNLLDSLGGIIYQEGPSEDAPLYFSGAAFADHLDILSEEEGVTQYLDFLVMRIRTMLSDGRMKQIISETGDITLDQWLSDYIGENKAENGNLAIIDLSLVPPEIVHIVTAVIARMVFEALQRYRKLSKEGKVLPTTLVMEEAHTFVKRYKEDENQESASMCCQVFERIAREGRKFGLGLVLSSQRPSELSPTVLSQCNSFLLHRISNDRDQDLVHRFVPDNLKGLFRELPSLPSQNAILLGWASELPILVRINNLPKDQQPKSDDPDFWSVWIGKEKREVDWKDIADDWQEVKDSAQENDSTDGIAGDVFS